MTAIPKRAEGRLWNGIYFGSEDERIEHITRRCMLAWKRFLPEIVVIEGYSFASKGNSASILHELGGVMKNKLHKVQAVYVVKPPHEVKKFATDSGGASKDEMWAAALERWPDCPSEDEADAFWMARLGHEQYANLVEAAS